MNVYLFMVSFSFSLAGTGNSASAPRSYKKLSMYNHGFFFDTKFAVETGKPPSCCSTQKRIIYLNPLVVRTHL